MAGMGTIGEWTVDRLNNWVNQRLALQPNVRALINRAVADATVPSGVVVPFAGASAPDGYLLCDGSEVSETDFGNLFAAIGAAYNDGSEGAGNFRLPDSRGRALVGLGSHADVNALADSDGLAVADRTPAHSHTDSHTHSTPGSSTGDPTAFAGIGTPATVEGAGARVVTPWDDYFEHHNHVVPSGTSGARSSAQTDAAPVPWLTVNHIIKI